jgi:hypothetical protein
MAIIGITTPNTNMHGYSAIPLRVSDTSATQVAGYKYLFNLLSESIVVTTTSTYIQGSDTLLVLNFASNHTFKLGDSLFIENSTDTYTGYYIVMAVPSATSIRINLVLQTPISGTLTVYKALKYKMNPGPDGDARIDFSNTLKDYVTQDLEDTNEIYAAPNTRYAVRINTGYESNTYFEFYDNYFSGGNVGFISSTSTLANTNLSIGDAINIQQNLYEATYVDSFGYLNTNGELKLGIELASGINPLMWEQGYTLLINGQSTYPSMNGYTTVWDAYSSFLFTNKDTTIPEGVFTGEGGKVLSVVTPTYNTTTTIKDLIEVSGELVVVTELSFSKATPAIGGIITTDSLEKTAIWDGPTYDINVFNSYLNQKDYTMTSPMNDYLMFNSTAVGGPSTIYSRTTNNRIERESKAFLLFHNTETPLCDGVRFWWYNSSDSALGVTYVINTTSNLDDFYCPIGIDQVIACVNKSGSDPSTFVDNIAYYKVQGIKNAQVGTKTALGEETIFEVSKDCSKYDMMHLMWKDAHGSWISYPFKYVHTNSTEVSRSNYYQNAWNWDNSSFGYNDYAKGDSSYFVRGRDKMSLNSGWVTENENVYIKDLLMSAAVYVQDTDGTLQACTLLNNELTFGSYKNDDVWQYKIDIKLANDQYRY